MEDQKTKIEMTFVEDEPKEGQEQTEEKETEEKPGFLKTIWNGVTYVPRWIGRKVKNSPVSAAIGMVAGAAIGYGTKAVIGYFTTRKVCEDFIPADPIEMPDDEAFVNSNAYGSTDTDK